MCVCGGGGGGGVRNSFSYDLIIFTPGAHNSRPKEPEGHGMD